MRFIGREMRLTLYTKTLAKAEKIVYNIVIMNKTLRKIVAITALVLMVGFIAFSMMYLINKNLLNGAVGPIALFCLGFTLALYFVIVFDNKFGQEAMKKRTEEALKQLEEEEKDYFTAFIT